MKITNVRGTLRAAVVVLLASLLAGCDGPDVEIHGMGSGGMRVRAYAYRMTGSFYAINVIFTAPQTGRFEVALVDRGIVARQGTLVETKADADAGKDAYVLLNSHLGAFTQLVIRDIEPRESNGQGKVEFSGDLGTGAPKLSVMLVLCLMFVGIAVFAFYFLMRHRRRNEVDRIFPSSRSDVLIEPRERAVTEREVEKLLKDLQLVIRAEMTAQRRAAPRAASEAVLASLRQEIARMEHIVSTEIEGVRNTVLELKHELSRSEEAQVSGAQALDSWARTGVIDRDASAHGLAVLKTAGSLCRLGNDLLVAPDRKSDRSELACGTTEWVTLERTRDDGNRIMVQRSTKPGVWLSCLLPEARTRMIVPASTALSPDDIGVLQILFRGAENVTQENAETLRIVRPAILPTNGRADVRRIISARGRILASGNRLHTSEYLILAMENALIFAVDTVNKLAHTESPISAGANRAQSPAQTITETRKEPGEPPLPLDMPAFWWQTALEQATMDGSTQPEDYAVRVSLAGELIAKALSEVSPGWAVKLAWVRFDFDNDCLIVAEVRTTASSLSPIGAGRPAPLRGRDLYQVMILVAHTATKQELIFIPLGEFLLDNHVTVFNRILRNPPVAPAYLRRMLRPAIIEKIKGKNYRLVPRGEMVVEVRCNPPQFSPS